MLGFGVGSTAYFSGTYVLRYLRKRDDYINHGLSGFINGAWIVAALGGVRKGVFGAIGIYISIMFACGIGFSFPFLFLFFHRLSLHQAVQYGS